MTTLVGDLRQLRDEQQRLGASTLQWWSAYVACGGALELGAFDDGVTGRHLLDSVDVGLLTEALGRLGPTVALPAGT